MASHSSLRGAINEAIKMQPKLAGDHQPRVKVQAKEERKIANEIRESRRPPSQEHHRAREDRSQRGFCPSSFERTAGSGSRFVACNRSTRRIIGCCVEERNEPEGGWYGARPEDRTGRSTHGKKQSLLLRRPDSCRDGANYARRKCRGSSCSNARKTGGGNNKSFEGAPKRLQTSVIFSLRKR